MFEIGGNGSWDTINDLLRDIKLPRMVKVRQKFQVNPAVDVESEIAKQMAEKHIIDMVKPGETVAITVGSRGIEMMPLAVKTVIRVIREAGGEPFMVPAMGSHAGATAEGQRKMLIGMGYSEEAMGAPIRSTMETVELGRTEDGLPVVCDKYAFEADHIVVLNRIKPHVCFRGDYESGLMKMITIGLGKQVGAEIAHRLGFEHMPHHIPAIANKALEKLKVLCAIGLVEDAFHKTAICAVLRKEEIATEEPRLLLQAKSFAPRLYFDKLGTLVIDEIGKNISGSGFDTNVVGRYPYDGITGGPSIKRVVILDISKESKGAAAGLGMADFTTQRAAMKVDFAQGYPNSLTSAISGGTKIPMTLPNDLQCIQCCVKTSHLLNFEDMTMVRIHNTLCLTEIEVSENLIDQIKDDDRFEILSEPYEIPFDEQGNLF